MNNRQFFLLMQMMWLCAKAVGFLVMGAQTQLQQIELKIEGILDDLPRE